MLFFEEVEILPKVTGLFEYFDGSNIIEKPWNDLVPIFGLDNVPRRFRLVPNEIILTTDHMFISSFFGFLFRQHFLVLNFLSFTAQYRSVTNTNDSLSINQMAVIFARIRLLCVVITHVVAYSVWLLAAFYVQLAFVQCLCGAIVCVWYADDWFCH